MVGPDVALPSLRCDATRTRAALVQWTAQAPCSTIGTSFGDGWARCSGWGVSGMAGGGREARLSQELAVSFALLNLALA
eukprot:2370385-Pleurochrysis_carterae.AAC.1